MAKRMLKRYGLEGGAKILIFVGLLLDLAAWLATAYYFGISGGKIALFIVPLIFTLVSALLLLVIRYRYTLFEKYPYLINLPSLFYHLGEQKDTSKQSMAFSMIFTVHALILAGIGLMNLLLTISIGYSEHSNTVSPFIYSYLVVVAVLIAAVFLQYRRIYIRFSK